MEFLIEFILELVLEGSIEASKSSKVPKPIRMMLVLILCIFFLSIIGLMMYVATISLKENIYLAILMYFLSLFMLIAVIIKFKKIYLTKVNK